MAKDENRSAFSDAQLIAEGFSGTPQGSFINTTYVDLSGTQSLDGLCLAKATEPRFELSTTEAIRLSRPGVFRKTGEVLIKDEQEGQARRETRKTVQGAKQESIQAENRVLALNAALQLGKAKISLNQTRKAESTDAQAEWMTFGNDWLIYCTSILPAADEEEAWRRTFPASYTSISRIYRPTQFAQALGTGVCEHIGATGKAAPMQGTFYGFKTMETHRTPQLVVHGPVLYVDDPYGCIAESEVGWPRICSMIFVKSRAYAAQKEYRFAMLSISPQVGDVFDLPMSGMLRDCLKPVTFPAPAENAVVTISPDESAGEPEKQTNHSYTYRRRKIRRQSMNANGDAPETNQTKEEIVEETVTPPDEVPDPFPSDETPDVIMVHQVGGQLRLVHSAYRDLETNHWRIETQPASPSIIQDSSLQGLTNALEVPPDLRLESREELPVHPGYVLDLCLNPSVPRPPWNYEGLGRCNSSEIEHVFACGRALSSAVEQVPDTSREAAAGSAWYAYLFIQDLVSLFGPVVKSLCVIRECVAVVELERAPFSGAVAWATFSGAGAYTLHVQHGGVEAITYSGQAGRAGPITEHTYVDPLQEHGWVLKHRPPGQPRVRCS